MPKIDNNVSVIKKWLDQGGDLSHLLSNYDNKTSFNELRTKIESILKDAPEDLNSFSELNEVLKKKVNEDNGRLFDRYFNILTESEIDKITQSGIYKIKDYDGFGYPSILITYNDDSVHNNCIVQLLITSFNIRYREYWDETWSEWQKSVFENDLDKVEKSLNTKINNMIKRVNSTIPLGSTWQQELDMFDSYMIRADNGKISFEQQNSMIVFYINEGVAITKGHRNTLILTQSTMNENTIGVQTIFDSNTGLLWQRINPDSTKEWTEWEKITFNGGSSNISDENNNVILGNKESHQLTENSKNNLIEGENNSVGIARLPAIEGTIEDDGTYDANLSDKIKITNIRLGDSIYCSYENILKQASIISIKDKYGAIDENANLNVIQSFTIGKLINVGTTKTSVDCFTFSNPLIISDYDILMEIDENIEVNNSHIEGRKNSIISDNGHVEGEANLVGAKCFRIISNNYPHYQNSYLIEGNHDILNQLQVGDVYSLKLGANYNDYGKIISIFIYDTDSIAEIQVDNFVDTQIKEVEDPTSTDFTFRIASKPWLGTIDWAPNSRASGVGNKVLADEGSADGRENIIKGRYGRASGRGNEVGYGAHAQNLNNKAPGERSSAAGVGTVASGPNSFTNGEYTVAASKNQTARGKYNKIDKENKYVDIVGKGETEGTRANAYALDWEGNAEYSGSVYASDFKTVSAINIKGSNTGLSSDLRKVQYTTSIKNIGVNKDTNNILKSEVNIGDLLCIDDIYYDEIKVTKDNTIKTQRVKHIQLPQDSDELDWIYSSFQSDTEYNCFYLNLSKSTINGKPVFTDSEIQYITDRDTSKKIYWTVNNEKSYELKYASTYKTNDCTFFYDSVNKRLWFSSKIGEEYSNVPSFNHNNGEKPKVIIDFFIPLETTITNNVTNGFNNSWFDIQKNCIGNTLRIKDNDSVILDYNIECESIIGSGGNEITIDSKLSTTSTNPVQNKVITNELNKKANSNFAFDGLYDEYGYHAPFEEGIYKTKNGYMTQTILYGEDNMYYGVEQYWHTHGGVYYRTLGDEDGWQNDWEKISVSQTDISSLKNKVDKVNGKGLISNDLILINKNIFNDDDLFDGVIIQDFDPDMEQGLTSFGDGIYKVFDTKNNFIGIVQGNTFYIEGYDYPFYDELFEDLEGNMWATSFEDYGGGRWRPYLGTDRIKLKDKKYATLEDINQSLENIIKKYGLGNSQS